MLGSPEHLEFVLLPVYLPELQPAERLWVLSLQRQLLMRDTDRVWGQTLFHWWLSDYERKKTESV
jgi:hypothetical protein